MGNPKQLPIALAVITLEETLSNSVILKHPEITWSWHWMKPERSEKKAQKEL